jgi:hypothetical protein
MLTSDVVQLFSRYPKSIGTLAIAYLDHGSAAAVTSSSSTEYAVNSKMVSVVDQSPDDLAKVAGVNVDTYSLARCIASEGYGTSVDKDGTLLGKPVAAIAIAQAVRNKAKRAWKGSITKALTYSTYASVPQWHYGEQSGRYASTSRNPNRWHLEVARAVINEDVPNLVADAHMFFDPRTQDGGTQGGKAINPSDEILIKWHDEGNAWIGPVPGSTHTT